MNSNTTLLPHYALGHSDQGGLIHQVAVANPHISGSHFALSEKTVRRLHERDQLSGANRTDARNPREQFRRALCTSQRKAPLIPNAQAAP